MSDDLQAKLQDGIAAARSGDRATGRRLLEQVTQGDPNNELAWFWLALCVNTVSERRACLERVLAINPNNARAKQALAQLRNESSSGGSSAQSAQDVSRLREIGQRGTATNAQPVETAPRSNVIPLIIIVLLVVAAVGGGALLVGGDFLSVEDPTETPTPTATLPPTNTPAPTNTQGPTNTPVFFFNPSRASTLPPTFTATPEPTETPAPPPTPTDVPLVELNALSLSIALGETGESLYRISGDGSDEERIEGQFRDITYDLGGVNVAFIRDVEYTVGEDDSEETTVESFPELFIAPVDDLENARQITEFQSTVMASPSFSPEGDELVFVSNFNGSSDIWYITTEGEGGRRLTENNPGIDVDPAWRPVLGSREVIFASDRESPGTTELFRLFINDPDEPLQVEQLTDARRSSFSPAWSDRGDLITFISDRRGDTDVYITDDQPAGDILLTTSDGDAEDRSPSFTPDGRFVVFSSNRLDDRFQTYVLSLDGNVLTRITDNERDDILFIYEPDLILRSR